MFSVCAIDPVHVAPLRDAVISFVTSSPRESQRTVWVDATALPANSLDQYALQVLQHHQSQAPDNVDLAHALGVEWWLQVRCVASQAW
jgi:hypothetical protein